MVYKKIVLDVRRLFRMAGKRKKLLIDLPSLVNIGMEINFCSLD